MVMMMTGTWAMDIYIHYENGTWPTGISSSFFNDAGDLIIDVEPTDVMGAVKTKIQEKTGFVVSGMQLSFGNHSNLDDNNSFAGYNIQKLSTLTLQYTAPIDPFVPVKQANGTWQFTMPNANKLMEVEYYNTYTLTLATNDPAMGTVELEGMGTLPQGVTAGPAANQYYVIPGTEVTVLSTANTGYFLENWTNENNNVMGTDEQITLTVTGDTTVQGNFALKTYTVRVAGTPDQEYGSAQITDCTSQCQEILHNANEYVYTVSHGTTITIEATPTTGHHFAAWEGDIDSDVNPLDIVGVDRDYTINAYFEVNTYPVTATSVGHGSVALSGDGLTTDGQHGKYGGTVTFTATPDAGYHFLHWNDDNTDNPRDTVIQGEVHLTATFVLSTPGLTPEGELTVFGGRFVNEHGQIVGQPRVTEHGEFIDYSGGATATVPDGAINGKFTINADGNQVYFSQGNLQASNNTANSATGWIWSFAEHQYDYIGNNGANDKINGAMTISEAGIIDLFSWNGNSSTSGDHYGIFSMDNNSYFGNMHPETLKNDWGHNAISNGGNTADMWRTLTKDEWVYVFNNRNTASGVRYARANVNGCKGVILLPDDWNTSYYTLNNTNQEPTNYSADNYSANTISLSDWENSLESHGAVFLPAAGSRAYGNANSIILSSFNSAGNYWSSSSYSSDRAYSVYFSNTDSQLSKNSYRKPGFSVRLVMDVE